MNALNRIKKAYIEKQNPQLVTTIYLVLGWFVGYVWNFGVYFIVVFIVIDVIVAYLTGEE